MAQPTAVQLFSIPEDTLSRCFNTLFQEDKEAQEDLATAVMFSKSNIMPPHLQGDVPSIYYQIRVGREMGGTRTHAIRSLYLTPQRKLGIQGDFASALLLSKNFKINITETTSKRCEIEMSRPDGSMTFKDSFTIEEAATAGLLKRWDKDTNAWKDDIAWRSYPKDKLYWRCFMRVARRVASDVLGGVYHMEELEDISKQERLEADQTPEKEPELPAGVGRKPKAAATEPVAEPPKPDEPPPTETAPGPDPTAAASTPAAAASEVKGEEVRKSEAAPTEPPQAPTPPAKPSHPAKVLQDKILNMGPDLFHYSQDTGVKRMMEFLRGWLATPAIPTPDLRMLPKDNFVPPLAFLYHAIQAGYHSTKLLDGARDVGKCAKELYDIGTNREWGVGTIVQAFRAATFLQHPLEGFLVYMGNLGADQFNDADALAFFECSSRCRDAFLITGSKSNPNGLMKQLGLPFAGVWARVKDTPDEGLTGALNKLKPITDNDPLDLFEKE